MVWVAPMTAVASTAFTAAQFNTSVRDNLLETETAKATVAGGYFVTTGLNEIAQRKAASQFIVDDQFTTSTSFGDLSTLLANGGVVTGQHIGPFVTVSTGTTALVFLDAQLRSDSTTGFEAIASYAVTGATTSAATDSRGIKLESLTTASRDFKYGTAHMIIGLNPGSNTFTMKYRATGSTARFLRRRITVIPL